MEYSTIEVNIKDLFLDPQNPRFIIPPNSDQNSIIEYLLEYEEITELAKGINNFKSLMPGERIIVCIDNGNLVVLEGNRRTCACKLLLDRSLVPSKYSRFPLIDSETQKNVEKVFVDLVPNRASVQSTLYKRHIDGVKDWSPISKYKFYAIEFINGMDIENIAKLTSSDVAKVKNGICEYYLVSKAISLKKWKEDEKPNIYEIKPSRFIRPLTVNSKEFKISGAKLLRLNFNNETLEPISKLDPEIFDHSIYLLAKAAFFMKNEFNTRSTIDDVPGLIEYLKENNLLPLQVENQDENGNTGNSGNSGNSDDSTTSATQNGENGNEKDNNTNNANDSNSNGNQEGEMTQNGGDYTKRNATGNNGKDHSPKG